MNFKFLVDGAVVVNIDVDDLALAKFNTKLGMLASAAGRTEPIVVATSTPASKEQLQELLARIDKKSAWFLKRIAADPTGSITWKEMRQIFGIAKDDDWSTFSAGFGKGITRAYRHILNNKAARLVWWRDEDWEGTESWDSPECAVYVDGPALDALREAVS